MANPTLGYGQPTEHTIDTVNQWMRASPWYQDLLASWGQDPNNVHLTESQRQQIIRAAQAQGVVVDEGNMEVDPSGNFNPKGHKLRNTLIVAGIAAATIATMGAAGAFSGAAGAGAGAGGAGAGAGAGTLAGIEGGAYGLSDAALAALGTGAMGAVPVAGAAGAAAAGGAAFDAAGNFIGDSSIPGATGSFDAATSAAAGGGTLSKIGRVLGKGLGGVGTAIGDAATAAGGNALTQEKLGLDANQQNIYGQSAFETELMNRAKLEAAQREGNRADIYRQSFDTSGPGGTGPKVSPNNPAGSPTYSPAYLKALADLQIQGSSVLAKPPQYGTTGMPTLTPYTPINPANVQGATKTKPGTLQTVGTWLGPTMTIAEKIAAGLYG